MIYFLKPLNCILTSWLNIQLQHEYLQRWGTHHPPVEAPTALTALDPPLHWAKSCMSEAPTH